MELEQAAMELGTRERAEITGAASTGGQLTKPATQRRGNTNSIAAHKLSLFSLRKCSPQLTRPHYMQPKEIHGGDRFPSGFSLPFPFVLSTSCPTTIASCVWSEKVRAILKVFGFID